MTYATRNRLPAVKFKPDDRLYLERWSGKGKATNTEEVVVDVMEVRHEPRWERDNDGRSRAAPAIYQVRVVATGEEFPADERGLNRYPKVRK